MSFDFNKDTNKKVHFIGIGGVSMSGLAAVLLNNGFKVSGSDSKESNVTNKLKASGAEIYIGHKSENLKNVDLVVYTAAIPSDNPEIIEAKKKKIELMSRAEFLGLIMKGHKFNVAVAGTHGKTTCTSMLTHVTLNANLDPTILVGGDLDIINGNFKIGQSEYFITEACEYKESFLKFYPYIGIILNIDADHLDYYKDINHIKATFEKFANLIPDNGFLIGYAEDDKVNDILGKCNCNTLSYGINKGDITAKNISYNNKGCATFTVYKNSEELFDVTLSTTGKHNILNALSTICVGLIFEIPYSDIIKGLLECKGAHKRFEYKGELNGATIIDDYAHHPVEIKATLNTAQLIPHNKIYTIFQPHTYTRTKTLFSEFTESFFDTDELILMDIYAAREKDTGLVSSNELGDALRSKGVNCKNIHSHEEVADYIRKNISNNDLILTVGAGDVVRVADLLLK
ncbi:UDP-N-acetylmuramate--L-alanine ligase [Clostridium septicum]|uniref:UDP-N-acetylmuramate--L-alanine ligase n=1 Tax=Clostridium septicum TaxID=1504 RepID=A0A9N7JMN6_CLOSE|nr:UDP-N-acetylmuramate--L-alanine ligase [Clostridium septicum]AYE34462.1 UDP-N-acetylmuramate--L-alanine ligase [Clostridium septicum]MDU1312459.1 UDP-N-acetylmuramate--L-alanine ligase [Clostridium septicum]QAS59865.1 UDP-N-acetylmuramate--L-alanine ligase [Clostridium septicum]UEC20895.1 UDP-N-acetylmuramate--L-alanine ligase [Clostridium septicum]USS01054.1 UDP-N-acetylmuramate--L-alanine ligase [Clostridium septicum]